ncbi:MAG: ATP-binding protein [Microcoleaceae cyanobacterium]
MNKYQSQVKLKKRDSNHIYLKSSEDSKSSKSRKINDSIVSKMSPKQKKNLFKLVNAIQKKLRLNRVGELLNSLSIAKKFSYSYVAAISVAVVGIAIGLVIAEYYEKQALQKLYFADKQSHLLNDLEKTVLGMRSHPQNLIPALTKQIWFDFEKAKFEGYVNKVKENIEELSILIDNHSDDLAIDTAEYKQLLKSYKTATNSYANYIRYLWQTVDPPNLKPDQIPQAQQMIVASLSENRAIKIDIQLDRLAEKLASIVKVAEVQDIEALSSLNTATKLQLQIILISILVSVGVATFLVIYISRVITNPLKQLTEVAKKVTEESNFTLQADVKTKDEVGLLAISLNQLILWVGEYTHQLEIAHQTLETRVEERTSELTKTLKQLQQTQSKLIQTEKMSSLGQMVGGIAHEINNPISFIYGNTEYAKEYASDLLELVHLYQQHYPHPHLEIQNYIEEIELDFLAEDFFKVLSSMKTGAERVQKIVQSLRNFSRLDESEIKLVNINEGVENTLMVFNYKLNNIKLIKNYRNSSLIECYPAHINQVFWNIIANAIDALNEIYSQSKYGQLDFEPTLKIDTEQIDKNNMKVSFWNNGPVIPSEIVGKLFDPFFTTKTVGKGTGLGLTNCYQIIQKHGGQIEVTSNSDYGTEFAVILPMKMSNQTIENRTFAACPDS